MNSIGLEASDFRNSQSGGSYTNIDQRLDLESVTPLSCSNVCIRELHDVECIAPERVVPIAKVCEMRTKEDIHQGIQAVVA